MTSINIIFTTDIDCNIVDNKISESEYIHIDSEEEIFNILNKRRIAKFCILTKDKHRFIHDFPNNTVEITDKDLVNGFISDRKKKEIKWIMSGEGRYDLRKDNVFVCSDTHFYHKNIIKYCNRPWNSGFDSEGQMIITDEDVVKMNENIIMNWNSVVSRDSIVYFLGDFCLGKNQHENIPNLVSRLNGKINLIMGNHDHHSIKFYYDAGFNKVYDKPILIHDFVLLSHEPIQTIKSGDIYVNLYGHVHNTEKYKHFTSNSFNCCVEVNDYKPIHLEETISKMKNADN